MPLDVARARRDTPGVATVTHLNNAGAALPPTQVTEAVIAHLRRESELGGYEAAAAAADQVESTYAAIGRLIGCDTDEIAVVENATRAWDMAFYGLRFRRGDRILTARAEYASNVIAFLQVAARTGAVVEVVDDDETGQLSVADLRRRLRDRSGPVKLIAITHVPTQGGLVNPAEEVGAAARDAGVPYLLDACQSVGQLPVDVGRIGCDLLSATGRKFLRGPRGTGFLYVRRGFLDQLEPPFLDLHAATWTAADRYEIRPDARRFENWETNYATKIGLGVAVDYALSWGLEAIEARVTDLADRLREQLAALDGVRVHDQGRRRCGIVTFSLEGVAAPRVQQELADRAVNVSVSLADYARFDLPARGLPDLVRASVHYYNDDHDLDRLTSALPLPRPTRRDRTGGSGSVHPDTRERAAAALGDYPDPAALRGPRLALEPLQPEHAVEMAALLDDPGLHTFTGGTPATQAELTERYRRQSAGWSPDRSQRWANWIIRRREDDQAVGTVQATVSFERGALTAEVAWVVATRHQGHGYASEAASTMVQWLREHGVDAVVAHVHPAHHASQAVAAAVGLERTDTVVDGEERWQG